MTKMQKDELYDEMCHLLTDYENNEDATLPVSEEDLYDMLVKIQNNWEELTGEDEEISWLEEPAVRIEPKD